MDGVAVVTGAGSGIGRAIAQEFAARRQRVVALDMNLEGVRATAAFAPDLIDFRQTDVSSPQEVDEASEWTLANFGSPSVVVNAAGWDLTAPFLDATVEFARKVLDINLLGPILISRAFLPAMIEAGGGRLVNIASDAGRVGSSGESIYAGAKGGVIALSKSLAREMARHSITVNCVCPGPTDTPLFAAQEERLKEALIRAIPLKRLATPEEVAAAVVFFASEEAKYITGQVLSVSGGLTMAG
ncbi:MAG: SDR family NAD(P)-dependent oxidoreductase [Actinomycetota bacterium]|nr:SDR family NAD(P)-dependent oxidoreductase [Actinomycetota bacterium]